MGIQLRMGGRGEKRGGWGWGVVKLVGMLLYLFVTFCAGIMSEAPKRNSTRERRPNRFLQLDDPDPPNHSTSRLPDARDSRAAPENTQLARLLIRFLTSANKKLREFPDRDPIDSSSPNPLPHDAHRPPTASHRPTERRPNNNEQAGQAQGRRTQEARRPAQEDPPRSGSKPTERKPQASSRPPQPSNNQHEAGGLRGKNPSSETQGSLGVQSQGRSSGKGERKKKLGMVLQGRGQREQLKPFKRQSYHVAIAYHIYLRRPRTGDEGTPARVDPTFHARRLREMQEKQP